MNDKIPATVAILTHNNEATLARALESVKHFAEIIICDGNSEDNTLSIASSFGARIISQDKQFLSKDGHIQNFAGVRNQTLSIATYDWFFFLDSDEYIGPELAKEILKKTAEKPAAYWIPRKYVYRGEVVGCSVTYPSQQIRLFHRAVTREFIKEVHERIELNPRIVPGRLRESMFVPVQGSFRELVAKWDGYLAMENTRRAPLSLRKWMFVALREAGIALLYLVRFMRITLFCRGVRLPASYELARVWYQWRLIKDSFNAMEHRKRLLQRTLLCASVVSVLFFSCFHLFESPETWMDEGLITQSAVGLLHTGKASLPVAPGIFEPAWYITTSFPLTAPLAGAFSVFGVSLETARLLMLVFLLCFYAVLFLYTRKAMGEVAAWLGFFFLVFFAPIYGHGRNVLGEVPGLLFMVLALLPLLQEGPLTKRRAVWIGLCAGLAFATKPIFILFLLALLLVLVVRSAELNVHNVFVMGLVGVLIPMAAWVYLQFDSAAFSQVLAVYANPHDVAIGGAIVANVKRLVTELQPLYFLVALMLWTASYVVRRIRRHTVGPAEEIALVFSLLVLLAYLRTAGYYRYFFPAQVFAVLYLPQSLIYLTRAYGATMVRAAGPMILGCILAFQAYETFFHSWTATHYASARTASLNQYFSALPSDSTIFIYQSPELVPFAINHSFYQYVSITPSLAAGRDYASMLTTGEAGLVMTSVDFFTAHMTDIFARYELAHAIGNYVVLRAKERSEIFQ